jgi:hypothetical protein
VVTGNERHRDDTTRQQLFIQRGRVSKRAGELHNDGVAMTEDAGELLAE